MAERVENVIDWKKIEIEHIIEPLDIRGRSKEMICRIDIDGFTRLSNGEKNQQFYTDRNGLDLQERIEDKREDYSLDSESKIG